MGFEFTAQENPQAEACATRTFGELQNQRSLSLSLISSTSFTSSSSDTSALVLFADGEKMDDTKNPWTVLSRATVYDNEWIRVDHHEVLGPSGGPGVYGTVHFKGQATGVVPIDENGYVILVGQYRFPTRAYSWEIPEGGGSHSATALESAQRELREECGLAARCWKEIVALDLSNSVTDERATAFLAWELSPVPVEPDETEKLQVERVPFWDAVDRAKRGEIRDAMSVAALVRVALMALQGELPEQIAKVIGRQGGR